MPEFAQVWNPDDWEQFSFGLLQGRHGALNVQKVPAAHRGDWGIDFYCVTDAAVYQCYSVVEPVSTATRCSRQKTKMTTDLKKLVKNGTNISKMMVGTQIKRWALLVPLHNSADVNIHCGKKTTELRTLSCPHLANDFEIIVQDVDAFPQAQAAAGLSLLKNVQLTVPQVTAEDLDAWQAGSPDLLLNATKKLGKRAGSGNVQELVDESVRWFLEGNAVLDALRSGAPDLHEKVMAAVSSRAAQLKLAGPPGEGVASSILRSEMEGLLTAVSAAAPNLSSTNADQIALGVVSEWIMRCPLDFPPYAA